MLACIVSYVLTSVLVLRPTDKDLGEQIGLLEPQLDSGFGPYGYGCYARATDKALLEDGQDGGVAVHYYTACEMVH